MLQAFKGECRFLKRQLLRLPFGEFRVSFYPILTACASDGSVGSDSSFAAVIE
jgi:hypothetical protein